MLRALLYGLVAALVLYMVVLVLDLSVAGAKYQIAVLDSIGRQMYNKSVADTRWSDLVENEISAAAWIVPAYVIGAMAAIAIHRRKR